MAQSTSTYTTTCNSSKTNYHEQVCKLFSYAHLSLLYYSDVVHTVVHTFSVSIALQVMITMSVFVDTSAGA